MDKKLVLASSSPRRREILENLNLDFDIIKSDTPEKVKEGELPEHIVMALALEKALDVSKNLDSGTVVIAADTIVYKDKVLGKPGSYEEAYETLNALQNDVHYVYTGIAVIESDTHKKIVTYEKTKVKIKKLSDDRIKKYIDTGEVWDKAGSYGIQGFGATIVQWIEGDYFNVVGLPVAKLEEILFKHFDISVL
ncbi:Maf family protein [Wukongibacter baidiensis]|uniref:Maf family protein n=1 Tax=Wukongibacter baidiensis TaxID=1723361 RepID=UPI003D7F8B2B